MEGVHYAEYRYRRLFPMTHEQYLDEPGDVIAWMVHIDDLVRDAERDAERRQREASGG